MTLLQPFDYEVWLPSLWIVLVEKEVVARLNRFLGRIEVQTCLGDPSPNFDVHIQLFLLYFV